jgi:hypothetical protein
MPITDAPRALATSTVRFVSVVVPDWLIATTSESDMSSRSLNPESSAAASPSTANESPSSIDPSAAAKAPAAMAAVPCPIA